MSRRSKILVSKSLYQIGVITLMASLVWASLSIYLAMIKPIDVEVDPEMIKPFTPTIKQEVLEELMTRRQMGEADWSKLDRIEIQPVSEEATGSAVAEPLVY